MFHGTGVVGIKKAETFAKDYRASIPNQDPTSHPDFIFDMEKDADGFYTPAPKEEAPAPVEELDSSLSDLWWRFHRLN